jgi:hypothetical protein
MEDEIEKVHIRPGVGLYALFPSLRYTPWVALGEMVDNSIQSYLEHKEELIALNGPTYKLRVEINFVGGDNPTIQIVDNAAGIYKKDIARAFTPAMPPTNKSMIGQYGIGMKSSACWYANFFTVRTRALGEPIIRTITFDIPKIIAEELYELDIYQEAANNPKIHGTRIILRNLHQPIPTAGAAGRVKSYLRSMYRDFLRSGELILIINGEVQEVLAHKWLNQPYWPSDRGPTSGDRSIEWLKDFEVELTESHVPLFEGEPAPKVRGWIGILEKGKTREAGLALLWRRKVVQGGGNLADSPDDLYRPSTIFGGANSFERQRVLGELDVSELRVTSFKDSVVWKAGQEDEALTKIKALVNAEPHPLLKMAKNFRATEASREIENTILTALTDVTDSAAKAMVQLTSNSNAVSEFILNNDQELPEPPRNAGTKVFRQIISLIPQYNSDIMLEVKNQSEDPNWLRVKKDDNNQKWIVTVNRDHPFMQSFSVADPDSIEPILRLALAIAIAEIQGLGSGFESAGFMRLAINDIVRNYLSSRSDVEIEIGQDE